MSRLFQTWNLKFLFYSMNAYSHSHRSLVYETTITVLLYSGDSGPVRTI